MKFSGIILTCLLSLLLTACGGGGGSGSNPLPSTATISSNMNIASSSDQLTLATDVQALVRSLNSQGFSCSGNLIGSVASLKITHVQAFLNSAIANIQLVKTNSSIDKTAISAIFSTYQSQDVAWITSASLAATMGNCGYSAAMISGTGYVNSINSLYAIATAQLNAM